MFFLDYRANLICYIRDMNEEIAHRFAYHPPKNEATVKALAQTHLEDAMYAANAAIARSRTGVEGG